MFTFHNSLLTTVHVISASDYYSSAQVGRMHWEDIPFERLEVSASVAKDIFRDDEFKSLQIPAIVEKSRLKKAAAVDAEAKEGEPVPYYPDGTVTCYRLADHVDISSGRYRVAEGCESGGQIQSKSRDHWLVGKFSNVEMYFRLAREI